MPIRRARGQKHREAFIIVLFRRQQQRRIPNLARMQSVPNPGRWMKVDAMSQQRPQQIRTIALDHQRQQIRRLIPRMNDQIHVHFQMHPKGNRQQVQHMILVLVVEHVVHEVFALDTVRADIGIALVSNQIVEHIVPHGSGVAVEQHRKLVRTPTPIDKFVILHRKAPGKRHWLSPLALENRGSKATTAILTAFSRITV